MKMIYSELGNYEEKDSLDLRRLLDELDEEIKRDRKIFETTTNANQKLDAHNDIKYEEEQVRRIKEELQKRGALLVEEARRRRK